MSSVLLEPAAPAVRPRPSVAIALAEGRRLVLHPAFVLGVVLDVILQWTVGSQDEQWAGDHYTIAMAMWAFLWAGTFLAAALVAGRQRWLSDSVLFEGTPVTPSARVLGLAMALVGPVVVALGLVAWSMVRWSGGFRLGEVPWTGIHHPPLFDWLQIPLLVLLAGAAGILVAQLPKGRLPVLVLGTIGIWFTSAAFWMFQAFPFRGVYPVMVPAYEHSLDAGFDPSGWVQGDAPLLNPDEYTSVWREVRFDRAAMAGHLVWVVGLIVLTLWGAMRLADDRDRRRGALVAGAVLSVGGLFLALATVGR